MFCFVFSTLERAAGLAGIKHPPAGCAFFLHFESLEYPRLTSNCLCSQSWSGLLILLPPAPKRVFLCTWLYGAGVEPRALCWPGKHCTRGATAFAPPWKQNKASRVERHRLGETLKPDPGPPGHSKPVSKNVLLLSFFFTVLLWRLEELRRLLKFLWEAWCFISSSKNVSNSLANIRFNRPILEGSSSEFRETRTARARLCALPCRWAQEASPPHQPLPERRLPTLGCLASSSHPLSPACAAAHLQPQHMRGGG